MTNISVKMNSKHEVRLNGKVTLPWNNFYNSYFRKKEAHNQEL